MNTHPAMTAKGYLWAAAVFALWLFGPVLADVLARFVLKLF